jgi:hypothetical protein
MDHRDVALDVVKLMRESKYEKVRDPFQQSTCYYHTHEKDNSCGMPNSSPSNDDEAKKDGKPIRASNGSEHR